MAWRGLLSSPEVHISISSCADLQDMLRCLLTKHPSYRPTLEEVLQHPWLQHHRHKLRGPVDRRMCQSAPNPGEIPEGRRGRQGHIGNSGLWYGRLRKELENFCQSWDKVYNAYLHWKTWNLRSTNEGAVKSYVPKLLRSRAWIPQAITDLSGRPTKKKQGLMFFTPERGVVKSAVRLRRSSRLRKRETGRSVNGKATS